MQEGISSLVLTIKYPQDFPGGPGGESPPSNAGGLALIPGWELRSLMLQGSQARVRQLEKLACRNRGSAKKFFFQQNFKQHF